MSGAFADAWMILKDSYGEPSPTGRARGHAMDDAHRREEDEEEMQSLIDERVDNSDDYAQGKLVQGNRDDDLEHEMHGQGQSMGPMHQQSMADEAGMKESQGMEMPQRPRGPPANIGQAGSTGGAPPREGNPFQQAMGSLQQRGKPSL